MLTPGKNGCPLRSIVAIAALGAVLAGCDTPFNTGNTTVLVPIAGGDKVEVSFGSKGIVMAAKDGVQIEAASLGLAPDKKHFYYDFRFSSKPGVEPKHVTVTDLTDDPVSVVADDPDPRLVNGHWAAAKTPRGVKDPTIAWMMTVDDSMRIYRFTIDLADGSQVVLDQPSSFPGYLKSGIRTTLGLDY
jgi:hypothetical protein